MVCDTCADTCLTEARFFLTPVLIGPSLFSRLRAKGSMASALGPVSDGAMSLVPSSDTKGVLRNTRLEALTDEETASYLDLCNKTLAHMGVPLKGADQPITLTEDAAETIMVVVQKVDSLSGASPGVLSSDLCLRLGVIYWTACHGILLRTASRAWRDQRKAAFVSKAKDYFSKVGERDDLHSIASWNLGMLCSDAGDWEEAKEHLVATHAVFPNDVRIALALARAQLEVGSPVEALSMVDETLGQTPTAEGWLLKGEVLLKDGRMEEALECFSQSLTVDPVFARAHNHLIATLRSMGRDEEAAVAERRKMISRTPDLEERVLDVIGELVRPAPKKEHLEPRARRIARARKEPVRPPAVAGDSQLDLALAALEARDYDMAIQRARHLVDSDPGSREANLILIESLVESGSLPDAASALHAFYERNRGDPRAWYWRGVIAEREGKWGAAVQYFSKSVTLDPELADAWAAMGDTLLANEKYNGADESYSRTLQIDGANARAWLGKGKTMRALGRWGAAIQCLDKYNSLVPNDGEAWLLKADTLLEKEKYRRAIDAYNKYLELRQDDSYALGKKGMALNAIGMVDDARACLEESVRLDPSNREAAKWLESISDGRGF
ncbi:MAG: tetratricopeptide repeat protein [Methanobacteriota archaeon]|nr:MAG: tetratricopeptide repeat protein [Euryarchaeota archaeon]